MPKVYRKGAIGAMADEYEKALDELKAVLAAIDDRNFIKVNDLNADKDFQSVRNIVLHMVRSGYSYANYIRKSFGNENCLASEIQFDSVAGAMAGLDQMFAYTIETFEGRWLMSDGEMMAIIIKTSWTTYDLEAIIEHAIVHILRHRRQIQKAIGQSELA